MIRHDLRVIVGVICLLATLTGLGTALAVTREPAGISFYVMRVIYPESAGKGVTLTAYSKASTSYLMQS